MATIGPFENSPWKRDRNGNLSLNPQEMSDQQERIVEHERQISVLENRYGLHMNARFGLIRFDPRYLSTDDVRDIVRYTPDEESRLISSAMKKQFLVIHACRIRKNAPSWIHETEGRPNRKGGFTAEERAKRVRALGLSTHPVVGGEPNSSSSDEAESTHR